MPGPNPPLGSLTLFRDLDEAEIEEISALCEEVSFEAGAIILEEGVRSVGLYLVRSGAARVVKGVRGSSEQPLAQLRPGDHFGEMSLVTDEATAATVRAEGATVCLHLPKDGFLAVLQGHPTIGKKVLWQFVQTLSRRLAATDRSLARALSASERTAAFRHLTSLAWMKGLIVLSYLWAWLRAKVFRWPKSPEALSAMHRRNARRFKETAFRLKGANVKVGQLAAMQAHLLPAEVVEELRSMRDAVTPTEYPLVASLVQSELGLGPMDLFEDFEKVPIAAASMGQVHVARLKTGEKVAVKILHPGLERSVRIDLALMRLMCRGLSLFLSKKFDLMQIMREAEEPLHRECDLHHEAAATEKLARELEPLGVVVPKIHWRFTSRRVMTMQFLEGTKIDDLAQLDAWKIDRRKLMETYLQAFLRQALEGGYFHCDPHPGNVFCMPDGRLAMLDFGMVKQLPEHVRSGLLKEILGGFFANPKIYADGLIEKGAMGEADRARVEEFATKAFNDPTTRALIFDHRVESKGELRGLFSSLVSMFVGMETFRTPEDNVMFMRALGIVIDVAKEVLPDVSPSDIAAPIMAPIFAKFMAEHPEYMVQLAGSMPPAPMPS